MSDADPGVMGALDPAATAVTPPSRGWVGGTGGAGVARNSALSMLALVVLGGTRVLYGALVSHVTDHETYGLIGVLLAITMISSFTLPAGLAAATSRFVPFHRGRGDVTESLAVYRALSRVARVAGIALGVSAGVGTSLVLHRPTVEAIEVALVAGLYCLYTTDKAALYGFDRVGRYVGLELLASVVTIISTVTVVIGGGTLYLLPFVAGYAVFVVGARRSLPHLPMESVGTSAGRRELAGYVVLASLGTLASAGFLQATQILAAIYASPIETSYFAAAVTLIAPMYFLPRALGLALFPFMSRAHGAGDLGTVRSHADLSTRGLVTLLAPVFAVAVLLSPEILRLFGGSRYPAGAPVLEVIITAAYLAVIQVASVNALSSGSNWDLRIPVGSAVAGCLIGLLAVALVGPPLGGIGVGYAYLLGTAITASLPIIVVWRRYLMGWGAVFGRAFIVVGGALAAARALDAIVGTDAPALRLVAAALGLSTTLVILVPDIRSFIGAARSPAGVRPGAVGLRAHAELSAALTRPEVAKDQ